MGIFESFRVALDMLRLHKLRAFLTMLGVIIGVMSVSLIVEVSGGFRHYLTNEISKLGADTIMVTFNPNRNDKEGLGGIDHMTNDDIQYISDRAKKVETVSGILMVPGMPIRHGDKEVKDPQVTATDPNQADLSHVGVKSGRLISENDLNTLASVCLIGDEIAETLFPDGNAVGKSVTLSGITLSVIGVMDRVDVMGQSNGKDIWVPITTAQKKWVGGDSLTYINCRPKEGFTVQEGMEDVWQAMMLKSGNKRVYRVDSLESMTNILGGIVIGAGVILSGVAALSLLVGGIGIMNIMLVSVTERTREIGLRKAVGAQRSAILTQFLVEAALLSLIGGLVGMALAWGIGQLVTLATIQAKFPSKSGLQMPFDPIIATGAAGFSALIGVVFGIYPAARAARLSPIEALRSE